MKKLNNKGFGIAGILIVVVIVGLIAAVGWLVYDRQKSKTEITQNTGQTDTQTQQNSETDSNEFTLPEGYVSYKYDDLNFSLAYPEQWGDLSAPTDPNLDLAQATSYIDNIPIGDSLLQGYFGFSVDDVNNFKIQAQKYGTTVSPAKSGDEYIWKVVEVNPADTKNKVGDTYNVSKLTSTSGVTLYDFTWQDEGATHSRFVFEVEGKFITVNLPPVLREFMDTVSSEDLELYNTIAKNIQDSVSVN